MSKTVIRLIGLMLFFGFSLGVMSFWFYNVGEFNCKLSAREHLEEKSDLKTITLPATEFGARPDKNEIKVNGTLYDVSGYTISGDSVVVTVWHDTEEESLQDKLVSLFENQQQVNTPTSGSHLAKYHPYFPDAKVKPGTNSYIMPVYFPVAITHLSLKDYTLMLRSATDVVSPPPDFSIVNG